MSQVDLASKELIHSLQPHPKGLLKSKVHLRHRETYRQEVRVILMIISIWEQNHQSKRSKSKRKAETPKSKKVPKTDTKKKEDEGIRRSVRPQKAPRWVDVNVLTPTKKSRDIAMGTCILLGGLRGLGKPLLG
ncbi:hypothetical protein F5I97DRAFT_1826618 [Phlebopus sp. FC_14]|nr:hypothetical protein F5I97DRAFT_1826618 [Phlebopus sp. FC_14]